MLFGQQHRKGFTLYDKCETNGLEAWYSKVRAENRTLESGLCLLTWKEQEATWTKGFDL